MTTRQETGHLLRRAGFGARPADFDAYASLSWDQAVDQLLAFESVPDTLPAEPEATRLDERSGMMRMTAMDAMGWFANRMLASERQLEERMTFFWHGHFASGLGKAPPPIMANQINTLRANAFGNFRDTLTTVALDPAMLLYLDGATSVAGNPNENYARELFELHTLGEGNYTEDDIKETARALTGWRVDWHERDVVFSRRRHDDGAKTIFGQSGDFGLDEVVDLVLEQSAMPAHVTGCLAKFFVGPQVSDGLVADLADQFVAEDFEVRPVVESILHSEEFHEGAYRSMAKGPFDFIAGTVRNLAANVDPALVAGVSAQMGQMLLNPPDPRGWPLGDVWINANSVLFRANIANGLTSIRGRQRHNGRVIEVDPAALLSTTAAQTAGQAVDDFVGVLLDGEIEAADRDALLDYLGRGFSTTQRDAEQKLRGLAYLILASPAYALA